ncbi:DUF2218 domain-containing protein [Acinetobacter faecalis]|uniref:DUF2218 domain-containing protein n=1 Tax=Acinetobacter faecalis TaxID=2665161 RepID=UPI002A915F73|nr:DUF2218 domain-containing protein [Acinetobacter faecalis]MDY6457723.1 DUF2218 domain-containing protein [Acinetobacter faecalis]
MKSISNIQTLQAAKIAKRLLNHWKHKFDVANTEDHYEIFMPSATVSLNPKENHLHVEIDFKTDDVDQIRLEQVVIDHLVRMGQEELNDQWSRS